MLFETHAHYEDARFDADREEMLRQLPENGITTVVNVGSSMDTSRECIELANRYEYIYAAVGVHPDHVETLSESDLEQLAQWCREPRVVALGEIGLDYHYEEPVRGIQKEGFDRQLAVACREHMPIIVHSREAGEDTLQMLKARQDGQLRGIIHCFGYSAEMARQFINLGFAIGVGGVVTFKNARRLVEVVERVDLSHIVLETDCPYMAPVPHRGERNSSLFLPLIAQKIAQIKSVSVETVYAQTEENARRVYRMPSEPADDVPKE